eukprot:EG_transcript_19464
MQLPGPKPVSPAPTIVQVGTAELQATSPPATEVDVELVVVGSPASQPLHPPGEPADAEFLHDHYSQRSPWLRAFVLGANDGLVVTAALMLGFSGGTNNLGTIQLAGVASWIAGALSMALGEYVSVSSQRDAETADIAKERLAHSKGDAAAAWELQELTNIYVERGLSEPLARQVAEELTSKDAIRAHARDELGIDVDALPNPWQAAFVSALAFTMGAAIPLLAGCFLGNATMRAISVVIATLAGLAVFGSLGAWLGGANPAIGALRVVVGGGAAMGATYGIGLAFGASVHG